VTDDDVELLARSNTVVVPTLVPVDLATAANRPSRLGVELNMTPADFRAARLRVVGRLHRAGVRVIAGSDCGVGYTPHDVVTLEVALLHEAGLSNAEALLAATGRAADALGLERAGRLAPGRPADVLVVRGDPLADLGALRRPLAVYKEGRPVGETVWRGGDEA
jgi:imidazolonepropionase-like amidohydrolase